MGIGCGLSLIFGVGAGCSQKPSLVITSPAHGAFHISNAQGSTVSIQGALRNANLSTATVRLWWNEVGAPASAVTANLNTATGTFQADLTLPSGSNDVYYPIVAEARYGAGGAQVLRAVHTIVVAETPAHVGDGDAETVLIRVNDSGIDVLEPGISSIASSQLNIGQVVGNNDLLNGAAPCLQGGPFGTCLFRINSVQLVDETMGAVSVFLDSQTNHVHSDINVDGLDLTLRVKGKVSGIRYTCDVAVDTNGFWVNSAYRLDDDPMNPANVSVEQAGDAIVDVPWSSSDLDCAGLIGGAIGNLISFVASPNVTNTLEGAIETALNGDDKPIATAFEDALANIGLARSVGTSLDIDLDAVIDDVPEDVSGVTVAAGIFPKATATRCDPGEPLEGHPKLCPLLSRDTYMVPTVAPTDLTAVLPTPDALPYDIAVGFSDTAFSTLFKEMSAQGHFSGRVTQMESCRTFGDAGEIVDGPGLTFKCLLGNDPFMCTVLGVNCSDAVQIQYYPTLPIVSRGGYGLANSMGDLAGLLNVDVMTDPARQGSPGAPKLQIRISVRFEAGYDLITTTGVGGETQLGIDILLCTQDQPGQPCTPDIDVTTVFTNFPNAAIGPNIIDLFLLADDGLLGGTLADSLDAAVQTFPLPDLEGKDIQAVRTLRHGGANGHLMLFGNLVN